MIPLMKIFHPPNIGEKIEQVYSSGFITEGEYSDKFERMFGEYIGNKNTCLLNSCTSALTIAAHMCDIKGGDEVITTAMTCMATNEPFYNAGAKLVFADIDPTTGNIDPDDIERKITSKTKAIVLVHWGGQPADISRIVEIGKEHNIKIVEDAAHAVQSFENDIRIGNHGDYICFSFQAVKHLSTVDGGAIVCKFEEDAHRIRKLRWFGLDRHYTAPAGQPPASRWDQDISESGYKMHMNNVNAAIGIVQMDYINGLVRKHIEHGLLYDDYIDNEKITKLNRPKNVKSSYWIYSLLVDDIQKFNAYMRGNDIATDVVHVRNDRYSVFKKFRTELPNLDYFSEHMTNIPVGWWLNNKDVFNIIEVINAYE